MKDVFTLQPLAAWGLIIGSAAIIGVPLFPVFLSKLNILTQLADYSLPILFVILVCFLIVAAAFAVILVRTIPQTSDIKHEPYRVSVSMKLPIIILFAGIVLLGVYFPGGLHNMLVGIVNSLGF
jgi:hydrogenase-4 component F